MAAAPAQAEEAGGAGGGRGAGGMEGEGGGAGGEGRDAGRRPSAPPHVQGAQEKPEQVVADWRGGCRQLTVLTDPPAHTHVSALSVRTDGSEADACAHSVSTPTDAQTQRSPLAASPGASPGAGPVAAPAFYPRRGPKLAVLVTEAVAAAGAGAAQGEGGGGGGEGEGASGGEASVDPFSLSVPATLGDVDGTAGGAGGRGRGLGR